MQAKRVGSFSQRLTLLFVSSLCGLGLVAAFILAVRPAAAASGGAIKEGTINLNGVGASDLIYNPKDGCIYTLNSNDSVSIISGTRLLKTVALPTGAHSWLTDLAVVTATSVSGKGQFGDVYVAQWFYDQVVIVRNQEVYTAVVREDDARPGPDGIENGPAVLAFNPVNKYMYVATTWSGETQHNGVTILDGAEVITHVVTGAYPNTITFDPDGRAYVTNAQGNSVTRIAAQYPFSAVTIQVDKYPTAAGMSQGRLFVANRQSSTVTIIDGNFQTSTLKLGNNFGPMALYADPRSNGSVYVVNHDQNSVSVITNTSITPGIISVKDNPLAIAGDPATGLVYVANQMDNSVSIISATSVIATVKVGRSPVALTVTPQGDVYVANYQDATVMVIRGQQVIATIGGLPRLAHAAIAPINDGMVVADLVGRETWFLTGTAQTIRYVDTLTIPLRLWDAPNRSAPLYDYLQVAHQPLAVAPSQDIFVANHYHADNYQNSIGSLTWLDQAGNVNRVQPLRGQPYDTLVMTTSYKVYTTVGVGVDIFNPANSNLVTVTLPGARALAAWDNLVYVVSNPNEGVAALTIINDDTSSKVQTYPLPDCITPAAIAIDKNKGIGYISCSNSASVQIFSRTGLGDMVRVGWFPQAIVINPRNGYTYVAAQLDDQVAVLSGTQLIATIPVPSMPIALDIDAAGRVFATCELGNSLAIISETQLLTTIPLGDHPDVVKINPVNQEVFVGSSHEAKIYSFKLETLPTDAGDTWGQATSITSSMVYIEKISTVDDVDWYKVNIPEPGTHITLTLGGLAADYDLALFDRLDRAMPVTNTIASLGVWDMDTILPDGSLQTLGGIVDVGQLLPIRYDRGGIHQLSMDNQTVRPRFSTYGQRIESTGVNGQLTTERIADQLWETGAYYVAVWGYNGAHGETPYTLHVEMSAPAVPITPTTPISLTVIPTGTFSASVNTLILFPQKRIRTLYADTVNIARLDASLYELAHSPGITGVIVDTSAYTDVLQAYAQWDAHPYEPKAANYVVEVTHQLMKELITRYYPHVRYIVLVGNDSVLPFLRVPDLTLIANEKYYNNPAWFKKNGPMQARLQRSYLLSDNYYASLSPYTGAGLYIPEYAIGRLVETPIEMNAAIRAYLDDGPKATLTTALVTGYDFLIDEAQTISATLENAGITVTGLISDGWSAAALRPLLLENSFSALSLNGHFSHFQLWAGDLTSTISSAQILAASTQYTNVLAYSTGCQSGLNVPDGDALSNSLDFAQAFASRGVAYIGNTGYGYGDTMGQAYSEELAVRFTELIAAGNTTVGEAIMRAKQTYLANAAYDSLGEYDEKILSEWTLYGLPMLQIAGPGAAVSPSPLPPVPNQQSLVTTTLALTPTYALAVTPNGRYYTATAVAVLTSTIPGGVEINPGRPIQPYFSLDIHQNNTLDAHGVLFLSGAYTTIENFDPVIARIVTDTAAAEPAYEIARWYPDPMHFLNRLALSNANFEKSEKLVVIPAQYQANGSESTERLYTHLAYQLFYAPPIANADFFAPDIVQVQLIAAFNQVNVRALISDTIGVMRAVATCDNGLGSWSSYELRRQPAEDARLWVGSIAANKVDQCIVQAVDFHGNVAVSDNKGIYFKAVALNLVNGSGAPSGTIAAPGSRVEYRQIIVNNGGGPDTFRLTFDNAPIWPNSLPDTLITLDAGQFAEVSLILQVPADAISGTMNTLTVTATSLSNPLITGSLQYQTIVSRTYGLQLSPENLTHVIPGATIYHTFLLTNTGNAPDSFLLNTTRGSVTPNPLQNVGPHNTAIITVTWVVPDLPYSATITTTVTAQSVSNSNIQTSYHTTARVDRSFGVTLSPQQTPSDYPGTTITLTHFITNTGNASDTFTLTVQSKSGWIVPPSATITLTAWGGSPLHIVLTIPASVPAWSQESITITAISWGSPTVKATTTDMITALGRLGVAFGPPRTQAVLPGGTAHFTHTITNTGTYTDTYGLSASPGSQAIPSSIKLGMNKSAVISVYVDVPAKSISGTLVTSLITATSAADPQIRAIVTDTTLVLRQGGLSLSGYGQVNALPGVTISHRHILTNTGNSTQTFRLTISPGGKLDADQVTLPAYAAITITVDVLIPTDSISGTLFTTFITATNVTYPLEWAAVSDITRAARLTRVATSAGKSTAALPSQVLTFTHTITNTGNYTNTYGLSFSSGSQITPSSVTLGINRSAVISLSVIIPARSISGTVFTSLITVTPASDPRLIATITDTTLVLHQGGVSLSGPRQASGFPGTTISHQHIITNTGNSAQTFLLTVQGGLLATDWVTLQPFASTAFTVGVQIPPGSISSTLFTTILTATNVIDPFERVSVTDTTHTAYLPGVRISAGSELTARPSQQLTFTHVVTNTSNYTDTLQISAKPYSLVNPESILLGANQNAIITVTITIPVNSIPGTGLVLFVRAASTAMPLLDDTAVHIVKILPSISPEHQVYLPIILLNEQATANNTPNVFYQRQYSGSNLQNWDVVVGDGVYAAPGELAVSLDDIQTIHETDYSRLRANILTRRIMAHNITFLRLADANALNYQHTGSYQFKLPYQPSVQNATFHGETIEGHLAVWDGAHTRRQYLVAFQWVLNPWSDDYGKLRAWKPPGEWASVGYLNPDTTWNTWHAVKFMLDVGRNIASFQLDETIYSTNPVSMAHDDWGDDVSAILAAEIISLYPGDGNGSLHEVYFRNYSWVWGAPILFLPLIIEGN
jgi:YVTN family beta-propeller protein